MTLEIIFKNEFKLKIEERFSNMCSDLKLPGNKNYTDNELFGLTCSDYANFNL